MIDAKGSASQSDDMKFEINKGFGTVDVDDQLSILMHIRDNVKYIDRSRIGIWGKGYGGYLTGKILEQDQNNVHCAIAVAPVTSWIHYLSIWTERYMSTQNLTDNYRGYDEADLTRRPENFHNKKLLIIHGTADRKVHYQHSLMFVRALSEKNVLFRQLLYPDEDHDFETTQEHVLQAMESFWNECFGAIEYQQYEEGLNFLNFGQEEYDEM